MQALSSRSPDLGSSTRRQQGEMPQPDSWACFPWHSQGIEKYIHANRDANSLITFYRALSIK